MALVKCPECSNDVSSAAAACPRCGHPMKEAEDRPAPAATSIPAVTAAVPLVIPPRRVRPFGLSLGAAVTAFGLWLLFAFIPDHDAANLQVTDLLNSDKWVFKPELKGPIQLVAIAVILVGVMQIINGGWAARPRIGFCKQCNAQVLANRTWRGWRCQRCTRAVQAS
jgi:hypothetical protein